MAASIVLLLPNDRQVLQSHLLLLPDDRNLVVGERTVVYPHQPLAGSKISIIEGQNEVDYSGEKLPAFEDEES